MLPVPPIKKADPNEPLDFSQHDFGFAGRLKAEAASTFGHLALRYDTLGDRFRGPTIGIPSFEPVNDSSRNELTKDRPGLEIPDGISNLTAYQMAHVYDNDKYLNLVGLGKPTKMGTVGAFTGGLIGGAPDPIALMAAGVAGSAIKAVAGSIAARAVSALGAREIFGVGAARVGTAIQTGVTTGAANAGFQAGVEGQEIASRRALDQPYDYIQGLQNVGEAAITGAALGLAAPVVAQGVKTLFERSEFENIAPKTKAYVQKVFKVWSKDSDVAMREEATGQMMNGQDVNLDVMMKQGLEDGGKNFRKALRNAEVDVPKVRESLLVAKDNIVNELAEIDRSWRDLHQSHEEFKKTISEQLKNPEALPDDLRQKLELEEGRPVELKKEFRKIETSLRSVVGSELYNSHKLQDRLASISGSHEQFQQLRRNLDTFHTYKLKADELLRQDSIIKNMLDHIDDTHERLTPGEVKQYSEHVRKAELNNPGAIPTEAPELTVQDYLNEYPEERINQLEEAISHDEEAKAELRQSREAIENEPKVNTLIQELITCILKGGL